MAVLVLVTFPFQNFDTFWHMSNGRAMIEEGRIINEEIFSFTAQGGRFHNHEWLTQILLYLIYDSAGAAGFALFKALMAFVIALLLYKTSRIMGADAVVASLLVVSAVLAGLHRYTIRPQLFSFVFIALSSLILYGTRGGVLKRKYLYALPLIMLIWDVTHGGIYGLIFLGAFVAGETAKKIVADKAGLRSIANIPSGRYLGTLWTAVALTLLVSVANPYGVRTYEIFTHYITNGDNLLVLAVLEFMPTSLGESHLFWTLLVLVWALTAVFFRKADITQVFLLIPFSYLAIRYNRVTAVFALVAVPVLAYYATLISARLKGASSFEPLWRWGRYAFFIAAIAYISYIKFFYPGHPIAFGYELNTGIVPRAAVQFVRSANPKGNMYNPGHMGGYLAYELYPERKIFMYNHHIVFSHIPELIHNRRFLEEYGINYAFIDDSVASRLLFSKADWVTVYWDSAAIVVVRNSSENRGLIDRYGLRYFLPGVSAETLGLFQKDPDARQVLIKELSGILAFREDALMAGYLGRLVVSSPGGGRSQQEGTVSMIEAALRRNPGSGPLWGGIGLLYYRGGLTDNAQGAFIKALSLNPSLTAARVNLAYISYDRGSFTEAEAGFLDAIRRDDKMADAYYGLALTRERLGKFNIARRDWENYLRLVPNGRWADKARYRLQELKRRQEVR